MTTAAKFRRAFRHKNEPAVIRWFEQTRAGQHMRPGKVRACARQILMNHTAALRRQGIIASL